MRGFDDKALLLFPDIDYLDKKPASYLSKFAQAKLNLCKYLASVDIVPHVFYTDDVARAYRDGSFKFVSTLGRSDRFFISKHCNGCTDALSLEMIEYEDIYNEILSKDGDGSKLSENDRFTAILQHASKCAAKLIPQYKIVIQFCLPNKSPYRVSSKPNDGKIRIKVDLRTFEPKVYISGNEEDACRILNVPYGNRCLDIWEV